MKRIYPEVNLGGGICIFDGDICHDLAHYWMVALNLIN